MQCYSSSFAGQRVSSLLASASAPFASWLFLLFSLRLFLGDLGASCPSSLLVPFSFFSSLSEHSRAAKMYLKLVSVSSMCKSFDFTDHSILHLIDANCVPSEAVNGGRLTSRSFATRNLSSSRACLNLGTGSPSLTAANM